MSPKIHASFWSDPDVENLDSQKKLCLLWIITNPKINCCGFFNSSPRRFSFETGLPQEVLKQTLEALPRALKGFSDGTIWSVNFISHQFGRGSILRRNNIFRSIVRICDDLKHSELRHALISEYDEIMKALPSPSEGLEQRDKPKGEGEGEGEGEGSSSGKERGVGEEKPNPPEPVDLFQVEIDFRKKIISEIFHRRENTKWTDKEARAFNEFPAKCDITEFELVAAYYRSGAPYLRKDLQTLLNNWPGELDRARQWKANPASMTHFNTTTNGHTHAKPLTGSTPNNGF